MQRGRGVVVATLQGVDGRRQGADPLASEHVFAPQRLQRAAAVRHALVLHGREQDGLFLGVVALVGELAHEGDDGSQACRVRPVACGQFLIDGAQAVHHLQDVVMLVRELLDGVVMGHGGFLLRMGQGQPPAALQILSGLQRRRRAEELPVHLRRRYAKLAQGPLHGRHERWRADEVRVHVARLRQPARQQVGARAAVGVYR